MDLSFFTSRRSIWLGLFLVFLALWGLGADTSSQSGIEITLPFSPLSSWNLLQWSMALVGSTIFIMGIIWKFSYRESSKQQWNYLIDKQQERYNAHSRSLRPFIIGWVTLLIATSAALFITFSQSVQKGNGWIRPTEHLIGVNGFWETLQAFCLLAASFLLIYHCWKYRISFKNTATFIAPLGLAIILFFIAGEELNWGQSWFNYDAPGWIQELNQERKINVHEMSLFGFRFEPWADLAFKIFIFTFAILLPMLAFFFNDLRLLFTSIKLPLPPIYFVPFALLALTLEPLFSIIKLQSLPADQPVWSLSEMRESLFALIVLGTVIYHLALWKKTDTQTAGVEPHHNKGMAWL